MNLDFDKNREIPLENDSYNVIAQTDSKKQINKYR